MEITQYPSSGTVATDTGKFKNWKPIQEKLSFGEIRKSSSSEISVSKNFKAYV